MATVVLDLGTLINGSMPTGTPPFLTASFETVGVDTVQLTMTNNMPTSNFVDNWLFNTGSASPLTFTYVSGVVALSATSGLDFSNGGSNMKAGLFDIEFHYPSQNSDPNRFHGGEFSIYTITGSGLTENNFAVASVDDPGSPPSSGGWMSAGHVQGFGSGQSGSIGTTQAVPEPASITLLGLGALSLALRRRAARRI